MNNTNFKFPRGDKKMTSVPVDDFLTPYEAEHLINDLNGIDLKEYGSKQWFRQHETIDRLNI